jgi:hypothetical protein
MRRGFHYSLPTTDDVKYAWGYAFTPHHLHGVKRNYAKVIVIIVIIMSTEQLGLVPVP